MSASDLAREREPQPGAGNSAGERIVSTHKFLENLFFETGGDTKAAVADGEFGARPAAGKVQIDLLAIRRVFFGVGKKIEKDLGESIRIPANNDRRIGQLRAERETVRNESGTVGFND